MNDGTRPLLGLHGGRPAAPPWFRRAIAAPFEPFTTEVEGALIEGRAWGERGQPGLVLLHGNAPHLGWWSFLAPLFSTDRRVISLSFGGMGASSWRSHYSIDLFVAEALAVADAGGASDAGPPVFVGHSLGGVPVLRIAHHTPVRLRGGIIVDSILPDPRLTWPRRSLQRRVYAHLPEALDAFRFSPPQPCTNVFIADHIARAGLVPVEGGWTWRFDRKLRQEIDVGDAAADLAGARAPLAVIRAEHSELTDGVMQRRIRSLAPSNAIFIEIEAAYHHVMVDQPIALVEAIRSVLDRWS